MVPQTRGHLEARGAEQISQLRRKLGELLGVKGSDVSEEHGSVAEVFGDGRVGGADGGEAESGLLLEEIDGGFELFVDQLELCFVAIGVAFDFALEDGEAELLGAPARGL